MPTGGRLLLDADHWFIEHYYEGLSNFEPDVQQAFKYLLTQDGTFIDCGANAGFHSVLANDVMKGSGTVLAIEANAALLPQLNANLKANRIDRPAIHAAIGLAKGAVDFFIPARTDVVGGLRRTANFRDEPVARVVVPAATLDEVIERERLERVDLVKIDIEGGELDAIRSAESAIRRFRPSLIVEYSSVNWSEYGATPQALMEICKEWEYRVCRFDVRRNQFVEIEPSFWSVTYANVALRPREKQ